LPKLDLEPHRQKLVLLVQQTEQFANDPLNILAKEKHFVVRNFHRNLVNSARATFNDAKIQSERWLQGVVLPLEIQMKDHKAQLQSRLDSLAKINEKTTSINEQMAMLRAAEQDLKRQREMIDGLISRVAEHGAHPMLSESPPVHLSEQDMPVDFMRTARVPAHVVAAAVQETARLPIHDPTQDTARITQQPETEKPLVPDDALAFLKPDPKPDPERTQQIAPLDPNWKPEPQAIPVDANPGTVVGSETTQRLNLSIQRLQEAKRLLQKN